MSKGADRRGSGSRYFLRFGITAFLLISGTLVLVLFVLPQRYALSSGFRESGMRFPDPTTPFVPVAVVQMAARPLPQPPVDIPPGPAELFWAEVVPHLESGQYAAAIPLFQRYSAEHPEDRDVRREHAVTLLASGRPEAAVTVLRRTLESGDDPAQRLLLARTLRDLGRTDEASAEYAALAAMHPEDMALALEWARALAWVEDYEGAGRVLRSALSREPESVPLLVDLARVYYSLGRLVEAAAILASMDDATLASAGALSLETDVLAALAVPEGGGEEEDVPPPTLLEQAVVARVGGDFERAASLFEEALRESPDDVEIWQAYADLLEYELGDLDAARSALLQVERLGAPDADLQYRLAQLEIWTDRNGTAKTRLLVLLDYLGTDAAENATVTRADVQAMLGDLYRWDGERISAARSYQLALDVDPDNERARDGLGALRAEVDRMMVELEAPRVGASAYSLADTDDFSRVDLGGEWVEVDGDWAWGGSAGNRWLSGLRLDGAAEDRHGTYLDLESARWWRFGTLRTGLQFGAQRVRAEWDYSVGASLGHRGGGDRLTELAFEHGPGYPITGTLQSVLAAVVQDRLTLGHTRPLNESWTLSSTLDAARLKADPDSVAGGSAEATGRLLGTLSIGRPVSQSVTLGFTTRALAFARAAPETMLPGGGTRPLFWDPTTALSVGPYARLSRNLSDSWKATGTFSPGLALIDERRSSGTELVPHMSAEAGIRREGSRYWAALDLFYYQGQFDGYRTYGARFTFSARDLSTPGGGR